MSVAWLASATRSASNGKKRPRSSVGSVPSHVEPAGGRFDYRIQDAVFTKETTGADGRAPWAPGRRYGVPTSDRKRGMIKIPRSVEA